MSAVIEVAKPVTLEPVFFDAADWERKAIDGQIAFSGPPATWCRPDLAIRAAIGAHALVRCPACNGISALSRRIHKVDNFGKVSPNFICTHAPHGIRCTFNRQIYLNRWNKKPLYAVALEWPTLGGAWRPEIVYCHARNPAEAKHHLGPGSYKIVAIGPVVGYFGNETTGRVSV